jgi:hypothetical protein
MVVECALVEEKLGTYFTIVGYFAYFTHLSAHFSTNSLSNYSVGETVMFQHRVPVPPHERTSRTVVPIGRKNLVNKLSKMIDLMISFIPGFIGVIEFLTAEFTNILCYFGIVQPVYAWKLHEICAAGIFQRFQ